MKTSTIAEQISGRVHSVVYFVDAPQRVAQWYAEALGIGPYRSESDFVGFRIGRTVLGFHPADTKSGKKGRSQVCYWQVSDIPTVTNALLKRGATWHRRTIRVSESGRVCQLKDPFGNIIGLADDK